MSSAHELDHEYLANRQYIRYGLSLEELQAQASLVSQQVAEEFINCELLVDLSLADDDT